jgi:hypothetical protein
MSDLISLLLGAERARTYARSARPDAPVVPPRRTRSRVRKAAPPTR